MRRNSIFCLEGNKIIKEKKFLHKLEQPKKFFNGSKIIRQRTILLKSLNFFIFRNSSEVKTLKRTKTLFAEIGLDIIRQRRR